MNVGVRPVDPTATWISVEGQQFEVIDGVAEVPIVLAAKLAAFPTRYALHPLEDRKASLRADPLRMHPDQGGPTDIGGGRDKTLGEIKGTDVGPGEKNEPGNLNPTRTSNTGGPDTISDNKQVVVDVDKNDKGVTEAVKEAAQGDGTSPAGATGNTGPRGGKK